MPSIRQLEAFCVVMETGSVSQAAETLHLTQPAVSKIIRGLEDETGLQLFTRERQRLLPTMEAQVLRNEVESLLHSFGRVQRMTRDLRSMALSHLTVAAMPAAGLYFLPRILAGFQARHLSSSSTLNIRSSPKVVELAIAQQFDVGLSLLPADHCDVLSIPLLRKEAVVIVSPDHRLAGAEFVRPDDFRGERFVSLGTEDRSAHVIEEMFNDAGVVPTVFARVDLSAATCEYVRQGGGIAIIDPMTAFGPAAEGLVRLRLRPRIHFDQHLLLPLRRPGSLVRDQFLLHLHDVLQKELPFITYTSSLIEAGAVSPANRARL